MAKLKNYDNNLKKVMVLQRKENEPIGDYASRSYRI